MAVWNKCLIFLWKIYILEVRGKCFPNFISSLKFVEFFKGNLFLDILRFGLENLFLVKLSKYSNFYFICSSKYSKYFLHPISLDFFYFALNLFSNLNELDPKNWYLIAKSLPFLLLLFIFSIWYCPGPNLLYSLFFSIILFIF